MMRLLLKKKIFTYLINFKNNKFAETNHKINLEVSYAVSQQLFCIPQTFDLI
jgi:hypothetical protein